MNKELLLPVDGFANEGYVSWTPLIGKLTGREWAQPTLESLTYDGFESRVNEAHDRRMTDALFWMRNFKRWIITFFVAIFTAGIAVFITTFARIIQDWKFSVVDILIRKEVESGWVPIFAGTAYVGLSVGFVGFAAVLVAYVEPVAAGSGISEIKTVLNGVRLPNVVRIKTLFVKVIGVLFSVAGGLPVGKEGPMIHSGAICAAGLSQGKSSTIGFDTSFSKFKDFRNDREKRDFICCGTSAGVSAAFGAPVGGVLFALEEGASYWFRELTWRCLFCAMISGYALDLCMSGINSNTKWGELSSPGMFNFGVFDQQNKSGTYQAYELPIFMLIGCLGGVLGAIFNQLNKRLTRWRAKYISAERHPKRRVLEAMLVAAVCAMVSYLIPRFYGDCKPIPQDLVNSTDILVRFYCKDDQYSRVASLFFAPSESSIKYLFHMPAQPGIAVIELIVFFVPFYLLTCVTYGVAVPSGLFIPSLLVGSAFGRMIGHSLNSAWPEAVVDPGTYSLIGAAAMLGGMARMAISLTVILLESTGDYQYGLPLMLTLMCSMWVGNIFNAGLYDIHIKLKRWPLLEFSPEPETLSQHLTVQDIYTPNPLCLEQVVTVGEVHDLLLSCGHNGFPVVEDVRPAEMLLSGKESGEQQLAHLMLDTIGSSPGRFVGFIMRKHLLVLLEKERYYSEKPEPGAASLQRCLKFEDFEQQYPRYPKLQNIHITSEQRSKWLDLSPYMNSTPFLIREHAPLRRAFILFRGLGLRHLVAVDRHNLVRGIVTRKELLDNHIERTFESINPRTFADDHDQQLRSEHSLSESIGGIRERYPAHEGELSRPILLVSK